MKSYARTHQSPAPPYPCYSALIRRALPLWLLVMVVLVLYWAQLFKAHRISWLR